MKKTRDEIAAIYQDAYPEMEDHYVEIFDPMKRISSFDLEFLPTLRVYSVAGIPHIPNVRDCDKRARKVVADILWYRGMRADNFLKEDQVADAIGCLFGYKLPFGTEHFLITGLFDVGIRNIDPLTDTITGVDVNKFNALLLVM